LNDSTHIGFYGIILTIPASPDLMNFGSSSITFTSSSIDLRFDFRELASNMSGVTIEYWCISFRDLTGMVQNDDLSEETGSIFCWIILGVRSDESSSDIFD